MTVTDVSSVRDAARRLEAAGVASPLHDARRLIEYADRLGLDLDPLVAAREARVPLQHITGTTGFRYLELAVGPGVFIPRPETELVVDAVLAALDGVDAPRVVDLCAGTGAIGLSVAKESPSATVDLVEVSAEAMAWLVRNAAPFGNVRLHQADLSNAPQDLDRVVDVVVSNPPYLPDSDRGVVEPEVGDHDPALALWGGADGLDVIRLVASKAVTLLRPGGTVVVEHADGQGHSVPALMHAAGFVEVADHPDLAGRPRYVTARLPC